MEQGNELTGKMIYEYYRPCKKCLKIFGTDFKTTQTCYECQKKNRKNAPKRKQ